MKIALVRSNSYQGWYRLPSIGLSYLAAVLEKEGVEVKIFDGRFFNVDERILLEKIYRFFPDIIGFTAMTHEIKHIVKMAESLKRRLCVPIIAGGPHITALPAATMEEFPVIDYGVIGEGEGAILDIIKYINGHIEIENIDGIVYRDNGKVIQNKPRQPILELDILPFPAFHHYFAKGKNTLARHNLYYQIFASRGCPFDCAFCVRTLGKIVRRRSAENISEEIGLAINKYGAHTINFADEIFLFNDKKAEELLTKFIEKGIPKKIRWSCLTRVDFVNQRLISLAKKAGCYRLEMGIESGNNEILKRINKNFTVGQIESAVNVIKKTGIEAAAYYIMGHPGETKRSIMQTIDLAARLNTDTIAIGVMVPYPGTKIYEWAKQNRFGYRLKSTDWDDYDKFGGSALEIEGLSIKKLENFQCLGYIYFYLKNLRFIRLMRFIFSRYKGILFMLKRRLK